MTREWTLEFSEDEIDCLAEQRQYMAIALDAKCANARIGSPDIVGVTKSYLVVVQRV